MAFLSMHRRLPIGSSAALKGRGVEQTRPCFLRGVPELVWQRAPEDRAEEGHPADSDPFDPPTI